MKQFSKALLATAIAFTAAPALAGYDEFDCRFSGNLELSGLACVSCGAQKYFADKAGGREVVPSEKWLALLGANAVQNFKLTSENKTIVESDTAKKNYQKIVISMVRNYGFCQNYRGKNDPKDRKSSDISGDDWREVIYPATTRSAGINKDATNSLAKYFGFDSDFLFGWDARNKMNFLISGSPEPHDNFKDEKLNKKYPLFSNQSSSTRRARFKDRLSQAFPNEYDVSGEKKRDVKKMIASKDKANGLDTCLEEVNRMQKGSGDPLLNSFLTSTSENQAFCKSMANACDIELDFCTGSKDSKPVTQPEVFRSNSRPQPPPPPMQPSRSGSGHK